MKALISNKDKYVRNEVARQLNEHYPNCITEKYADSMLAAKSVYMEPADVIVMGLEGIKLIPMLRMRESGIIVIILADNDLHKEEATTGGANAYISLPLQPDALFDAVEGRYSLDVNLV